MKSTSISTIISRTGVAAVLLGAALTCRADYATEVLAQQPITYWRFNETVTPPLSLTAVNSGSLAASGNGTYLSLQAHPPGAIVASTDPAAAFNGIEDRIDVPNNPAFNPSGAFTVELWAMLTNNVPTVSPLTSRGSGGANGYLFYANLSGDNKWRFRTYSGTTAATVGSSNNIVLNQWTHVVGVRDANGVNHLYIDGVEANTPVTGGYVPQTTSPLRIGAGASEGFSGNYYWPGYLDEVAFYPAALTAAQVAAHYANGKNSTPSQSYNSLVLADGANGYWRLNEAQAAPTVVKNLGSLGVAGDGTYRNFTTTEASTLVPTTYPGLDSANRDLRFDGTNTPVNFGITNVPLPWTAAFWLNRQDALGASAVLLNSSVSGIKSEQWGTTRLFGFTAYGVADYNFNYSAPVDTWVHVALVATPGSTALYVDGALQETYSASTSLPLLRLGNMVDAPKGAIDELATFNRPLLEGQIKTLYLTATGSTAAPGFVSDTPIVSPAGTIYATTPFSLAINVYGTGPLTYEWTKDGNLVGTGREFSKAAATTGDSGNYQVVVKTPYGSITSAIVNVTINPAVPPSVAQQPVSRAVFAGGNVRFKVVAGGTAPFTYQWKKGTVNLTGETNDTLVLTNITSAAAGTYIAAVTNVAGGVLSAGAILTVPTLTPGSFLEAMVTNSPVNYWRLGETTGTDAFDSFGRLDGVYNTGVTLGLPGAVPLAAGDTAVQFDGTPNGQIALGGASIPVPWTAIFWVNRPAAIVNSSALLNDSATSLRLEQWQATGRVGFTEYGVADYEFNYSASPAQWVQLVFVGKSSGTELYVNGSLMDSNPNKISLPRQSIGNNGDNLVGQLDEVALYDHALSADSIAQIYAAGVYGSTTAPFIVNQPVSEQVVLGQPAGFAVRAAGSLPLRYQWKKDGTALPGATGSVLEIANTTFGDAGTYTVTITNNVNGTASASVTLSVLPPPSFAYLTNSLVAHLKMDGDSTDSSGRMNDAFGMSSPPFVPGKLGQAVRIKTDSANSVFQYLYFFPNNPDFQFTDVDSFSVSFWLKYTTPFNDLPIIGNANRSTYNPGWVLTEDGGQFAWTADDGAVDIAADPVGGPMINDGQWHQLAVVFDRTNAVANSYVDGQLVDARALGNLGTLDPGNALIIGQDPSGSYPLPSTTFSINGTFDLDDLGIWRRVLSSYEILSIYNAAQGAAQSFDKYGPIKLTIGSAGTRTVIGWQAGTLEFNADLKNAAGWAPVPGAAAPLYTAPPGTGSVFYRVKQ